MTREIKFRAWDGKEMLDDWLVLKDTGGGVFPVSLTRKAEVVMQYTGLKDKNGKEIYESDIVRGYWDDNLRPTIVVWQAPQFVMKEKLKNKTWSTFDIAPEGNQLFEIIGNIYKTPDLLPTL